MAQIQIHISETTEHSSELKKLGYRWCKKDGRWEKNCRYLETHLNALKIFHPELLKHIRCRE